MIEAETLKSIATMLMTSTSVSVDGKSIPVRPSSRQHLRTAAFTVGGRRGHQVVQFKDAQSNKFVAVVVDGEATFYGARAC